MGSINISIKEEIYEKLLRLKKEGESFSALLERLSGEKDISRCYGILKGDAELEKIAQEAEKARNKKWRD